MQRLFLLFFFCYSFFLFSQDFTRKDSLRGNLTSLRTCYDVTFYDLNLAIDEQDDINLFGILWRCWISCRDSAQQEPKENQYVFHCEDPIERRPPKRAVLSN